MLGKFGEWLLHQHLRSDPKWPQYYDNRELPHCQFLRLGGGMADTTDLKSVARKSVRVRIPPQAPFIPGNASNPAIELRTKGTHMTRFFVYLQIILACACTVNAKSDKKADRKNCLYAVTGPKNTVYLQGSIHFLNPENYPLSTQIEDTFKKCETIVFEVDIGEINSPASQTLIMNKGILSGGKTLEDVLSTNTYTLLQSKLEEWGMGAGMAIFQSFKPWFLNITLVALKLQNLGYSLEHGLDLYFYNKAKAENKKTLGLETIGFQIGLLDEFSSEEQDAQIAAGLKELANIEKKIQELVNGWQNGDSKKIEKILHEDLREFPEVYKSVLTDRNLDWLPKIKTYLQGERNVMVIVGAGHLVGKNGLLELLRKEGYAIHQK